MPSAARAFFDWVVVVGVALFVAIMVRTFLLAHFVVEGESMLSTLHTGDRVFVNKLSYRLHDPNRGDVVVLHEITGASERDLIKRVIALAGEEIEIRNCVVYIDEDPNDAVPAKKLVEPYLDPAVVAPTSWCEYGPTSCPTHRVRDGRQPARFVRQPGARPDPDRRHRRPRVRGVLAAQADWQWL